MATDWRGAEQDYEDELIGWNPIPEMIDETAEKRGGSTASMYKGGIYDRSLTPDVVPEAPDGEYESIDYDDLQSLYRSLSAGFGSLGVEHGDRVGIFANTRFEWAVSDFAILSRGGVVTSVYASSSPQQANYLLDDPEATGVVVENQELLERVLEVEDDLSLEFIVVMDEVGDEYARREDVHTLEEVHERGKVAYDPDDFEETLDAVEVDDLCTLIYTSGTTGQPKGVKLTHRNFRSSVNQLRKRFGPRPDKEGTGVPSIDEDSRVVSFLPLAHSFERFSSFLMYGSGATVAYAESPDTLRDDFAAVRPTGGTSVPRVYEKMYDAIREKVPSESLFEWATSVGVEYFEAENPGAFLSLKQTIADKVVFSNVRDTLGGELEFMISGGGSLSKELCSLYHGMGIAVYEGYGLTETAPVVSVNPPEEPKTGTIGPPLPEVGVKLDETALPDSERENMEGEVGELLVKGDNVTEGYWEKPDATEEAFTDDGWFRTGDVVRMTDDGYLTFVERVKQLLVLSTGKNVAPQPIEDEFATSPLVEQCMVMGDDEKFVSALIVPNFDGVRKRAEEAGVELPGDNSKVLDDERVRGWIQEEVDRANKSFEKFETVKKFELVAEEWTEENDTLTPSLKKKRRNILKEHADKVDKIYEEEEKAEV